MLFALGNLFPQFIVTLLFIVFYNIADADLILNYVKIEAVILLSAGFLILGLDKLIERKYSENNLIFFKAFYLISLIFFISILFIIFFSKNLLIYATGIYSTTLFLCLSSLFIARGDSKNYFYMRSIRALVIGLTPIYSVYMKFSFVQIMELRITFEIILVLLFIAFGANFKNFKNLWEHRNISWKDLTYALPFMITTGASLIYLHLDKVILSGFMGAQVFIDYVLAQKFYLIFCMLLSAGFIRFPINIYQNSSKNIFTKKYIFIINIIALVVLNALIVCGYLLKNEFLPPFVDYNLVYFILLGGGLTIIISYITAPFILKKNKSLLNMISAVIGALTFSALLFFNKTDKIQEVFIVIAISYNLVLFIQLISIYLDEKFKFITFYYFILVMVFVYLLGMSIINLVLYLKISLILLSIFIFWKYLLPRINWL